MTTLGALFYADTRSLVNQLREIRRSPARAIVWALFALAVAGLIGMRLLNASRRVRLHGHVAASMFTLDGMVCCSIAALGAVLAFGERYAGLFAHPAEARFIIGSAATPFIATLYVQVRQLVRGSARQAFGLLYIAMIYLPATLPVGTLARDIVLIGVAFMFIAAVPLARQLMPRRIIPSAVAVSAICILGGLLPLLRDAAIQFSSAIPGAGAFALRLPPWHPGGVLLANAGAQEVAIAVLVACTGVLFAYVAHAARDAYPELYDLSMKRIQRTERLRSRPFSWTAQRPKAPARVTSMAAGAPGGVAIFIWRAWTEYRRTNSARSTALETAVLLAAGYGVARLTRLADNPEMLIVFASPAVNIVFIIAVLRSASLANELRRPLFWLSGATLFERLCALAVAQGWRLIGWCVLAGIGLLAGHAAPSIVVAVLLTAPAAALLSSAIGYASYGLLPSEIDQRGPLAFVRLLLGYVLIVPPIAAGFVIGFLAHTITLAMVTASATTLLEAGVLIGFAAWRLDRMSIVLR